jgi:NADPH:quinone reductase-like Zn-dependent oxidoreductase
VKIRAAVLEECGQPLAVQEVDLEEPKAGEALVRVAACGVCHTDLYTASGADPTGYSPGVLGHQGAGVVEKVGEGGRGLVAWLPPSARGVTHETRTDPRGRGKRRSTSGLRRLCTGAR